MKKLKCPNCKETLPQIGKEEIWVGDKVECGMCGHIWMPNQPRKSTEKVDGFRASHVNAIPPRFKPAANHPFRSAICEIKPDSATRKRIASFVKEIHHNSNIA